MVETAGLARKRHSVAPTTKFNFEKSFGYVQVGGAVFTHSSKLQQMCLWANIAQRKQQIEGADYVIGLDKRGVMHIDHRVRRRRTFANVNHRIGVKLPEGLLDESIVTQITMPEEGLASKMLLEAGE